MPGESALYIGNRLRYLRKRRLMTQERLAEKAGCSRTTVANLEANKREPQARTIYKLASALDVEPDELLGEE